MKSMARKKIVIDDVAKAAEVSTATVSRVINGYEGVSPDVISRVNEAIEDLGYIKPVKSKDKLNENRLIGVVLPNINNPYSSNLATEIQLTLDNLGYSLLMMDSQNDGDKSIAAVNTLIKSGITGLIYIPIHQKSKQEKVLSDLKIPIVYLGRRVDQKDTCFVGPETFTGSYNGANYLLSLGHKDILYVTGDRESVLNDKDSNEDKSRFNGFIKALEEKGMNYDTDYLVSGDYDMVISEDAVNKKLKEKKFSAIFASGDVMAYGAYKAVTNAGLRVPEDISILGFDDLPMSSVLNLTTVSHNAFGVGQNAGLLLHDMIEKRKVAPQEIILPTNLVIRSSCGISNSN